MNSFFEELKKRGLVAQTTDELQLSKLFDSKVSLYCGFDPTADSLHVGSLLPLITMLRFQKEGHKVFALIGGATAMIGDPSFKAQERVLNDVSTVLSFKNAISKQISQLLGQVQLVDNDSWTCNLSVIDFLRDIGKHFSVNTMLAKDSVRSRIERQDQGISFTEFSYQLLQAMDFHHLFKHHNCQLQLGGSDQWGNITAGIDLIHKRQGNSAVVAGLTLPLLVKSDGQKFGKSETGTIWLHPNKTSAFDFFQFWLKLSDEDVQKIFKMLSFRSVTEIDKILEEDKTREKPMAQQLLAQELTCFVFGQEALDAVLNNSNALFNCDAESMNEDDFVNLQKNGMKALVSDEVKLVSLLVQLQLATSKTQARQFMLGGGIYINGKKLIVGEVHLNEFEISDFKFGKFAIIQRGKREFRLLIRQ